MAVRHAGNTNILVLYLNVCSSLMDCYISSRVVFETSTYWSSCTRLCSYKACRTQICPLSSKQPVKWCSTCVLSCSVSRNARVLCLSVFVNAETFERSISSYLFLSCSLQKGYCGRLRGRDGPVYSATQSGFKQSVPHICSAISTKCCAHNCT